MSVIIIGGGQGAVQLAHSLRSEGYTDAVTLLAKEAVLPYQRPPLSKDLGGQPLPLRAAGFYAEKDIELRTGVRATALTPASGPSATHTVELASGERLEADHLVLATGARNRPLPCPGGELALGLRSAADAQALGERLRQANRVVVIGAGFIGLEFAAAARALGRQVTVLEFADRVMGRAVSAPLADWFATAHRDTGIDLRLGEGVAQVELDAVLSTTGRRYPADLVVYGIGVIPNTELAQAAGLEVENGIVVDSQLRAAPRLYALGDCVSFPAAGRRLRLESVQNATDQARTVARNIVGHGEQYAALPWFWSTQGPIRLQIAGLSAPGDEPVVLGDPSSGRFSIALLREGRLAALESVNRPADHAAARKLLDRDLPITADMLGTPLKQLIPA